LIYKSKHTSLYGLTTTLSPNPYPTYSHLVIPYPWSPFTNTLIINCPTWWSKLVIIFCIGTSQEPNTLLEKLPHNSPYFSITPCGTITYPPSTRKLYKTYSTGTEYDFYPNFICQKPKLKWNLMKFNFSRTLENNFNWYIPTARNTPISRLLNSGISPFKTLKQLSSTPRSTLSLSLHPIL
jgi:hypothetical protein